MLFLIGGVDYYRVLCSQVYCAQTGASTENSSLLEHMLSKHGGTYNPQAALVA